MFALIIFIQYHTKGPSQYIKKRKVWKERSKVPCSPSIPNLFFPLQISFKHSWIFLIFFFSLPQDILVPNPSVFLPCVLNKKKPPASVIELGDLTLRPAQLNSVSLLLQQWLNPSGSFTSSFANTLLGNTSTNIVPEPLLSLGYNMYYQVAFYSLLHVLYKVSLTEAFSI